MEISDLFIQDVRPDGTNSFDVIERNPTAERALEVFKARVEFAKVPAGKRVYRIVGFELKEGPLVFQPQFRDENGAPINVLAVFRWQDAPPLPANFTPKYYGNGILSFTEADGTTGFPFSDQGVIGDGGGPYSIWCSHDPPPTAENPRPDGIYYVDLADRLGWHGATNHAVLNPIYQIVRVGGGEPVPGEGRRIAIFDEAGNVWGIVPLQTGAPPAGKRTMRVLDDEGNWGFAVLS